METKGKNISTAEHILLEGDELDAGPVESRSRNPQQHFHIVNRSHALATEMILFEGGWLSVRHHKRRKPGEARMINLRYVDPRPSQTGYFAKRSLWTSAGLSLAGMICALLAYEAVLPAVTTPAAILLFTGAFAAFGICAYRTRRDAVFLTRTGRAPVIELMATLGSFRSLRKVVSQLIDEIDAAADLEADPQKYLRSEMREHYRLRECGVLDQSVCASSTQKILQHFK